MVTNFTLIVVFGLNLCKGTFSLLKSGDDNIAVCDLSGLFYIRIK